MIYATYEEIMTAFHMSGRSFSHAQHLASTAAKGQYPAIMLRCAPAIHAPSSGKRNLPYRLGCRYTIADNVGNSEAHETLIVKTAVIWPARKRWTCPGHVGGGSQSASVRNTECIMPFVFVQSGASSDADSIPPEIASVIHTSAPNLGLTEVPPVSSTG
jgi:hypothetical protein